MDPEILSVVDLINTNFNISFKYPPCSILTTSVIQHARKIVFPKTSNFTQTSNPNHSVLMTGMAIPSIYSELYLLC